MTGAQGRVQVQKLKWIPNLSWNQSGNESHILAKTTDGIYKHLKIDTPATLIPT